MKYLEWKSGSFDEENFQIVTSRKNKKTKRRIQKQRKRTTRGKRIAILLMRPYPL
jgi:hypothetical protein